MEAIDLLGKQFGNWTVLQRDLQVSDNKAHWICECACEKKTTKSIRGQILRKGESRSCGCLTGEFHKAGGRHRKYDRNESTMRHHFSQYLSVAKKKNRDFELSFDQFISIVNEPCIYCGALPQTRPGTSWGNSIQASGIDRFDTSLGYVLSNCVPCCSKCNRMKLDLDYEDFISQCRKIIAIADSI